MTRPASRLLPIAAIALVLVLPAAAAAAVPSTWDWRNADGVDLTSGVRNVQACGASYIFAPVAMVESRAMIARARAGIPVTAPLDYSEQWIMSCGTGYFGDFSCNGGYARDVLVHIRDLGVPTETCYAYTAADSPCPDRCPDTIQRLVLHRPVDQIGEHTPFWDEAALMQEIYDNGPVATTMDIYDDIYSYSSGVYQHLTGNFLGGHAVLIIGWGVEGGLPYWLVENCWGTNWGDRGYFKVRRDANHANCNFGEWVWTCTIAADPSDVPAPAGRGALAQNRPNPFNPATTIAYAAAQDGPLTLTVYDAAGRRVRRLVASDHRAGQEGAATWDGRDDAGRRVPSGLYCYRLVNGTYRATRRMVLLK